MDLGLCLRQFFLSLELFVSIAGGVFLSTGLAWLLSGQFSLTSTKERSLPVKNKDQDDLRSYKVHFADGSVESFHLSDDLIKALSKPDPGGYHPMVFDKTKQFVFNFDNVLWIEDVTPAEPNHV